MRQARGDRNNTSAARFICDAEGKIQVTEHSSDTCAAGTEAGTPVISNGVCGPLGAKDENGDPIFILISCEGACAAGATETANEAANATDPSGATPSAKVLTKATTAGTATAAGNAAVAGNTSEAFTTTPSATTAVSSTDPGTDSTAVNAAATSLLAAATSILFTLLC